MEHRRHRIRARSDDPRTLLAAARAFATYVREWSSPSAWLRTSDASLLRSAASAAGSVNIRLSLEAGEPAAMIDSLHAAEWMRISQSDARAEPGTALDTTAWTLISSWHEIGQMLSRGGLVIPVARDLVRDQLIARLSACRDAGVLRAATEPSEWVHGLLAAADEALPHMLERIAPGGTPYADSIQYANSWHMIHPGPPPLPVAVTFETLEGVASRIGHLEGIWHPRSPISVDGQLTANAAHDLSLPPGTLREFALERDAVDAVDLLFDAALRDPEHNRFGFFLEGGHWLGQESGEFDYFTASSGVDLHRDDETGRYALWIWTHLRYPASAVVTDEIRDGWNANAADVLARTAAAVGVELESVEPE